MNCRPAAGRQGDIIQGFLQKGKKNLAGCMRSQHSWTYMNLLKRMDSNTYELCLIIVGHDSNIFKGYSDYVGHVFNILKGSFDYVGRISNILERRPDSVGRDSNIISIIRKMFIFSSNIFNSQLENVGFWTNIIRSTSK